ncbi:sigma-70 family RNA polymerase sigma factor [Leucobacter viscericola]|uniref:Sigma-70 family RNA polymerase sigma factor n=1 Tax=Leucobacter viscericola TaxID=2714935 RepID=A0A6G7XGT9_9MICO|nr:sigma-70 family RNA polymerase sigma factor [Leucobacter viscericola]
MKFAQRLCSDRMLAEDAVAEAFVSVLKTLRKPGDSGPTQETFISYLRVCIRHEVAQLSRRMSVEETNADIEAQLEGRQIADESGERLDDVDVWDSDVARRAFSDLPERDQSLLKLTEVDSKPLAEVANVHGMTAQAVAAATYRARDALRTNYLVEAVATDPACPKMRVDFLAAFARGKAPSVRRRKIEAHLKECDRCPARLKKMLSYRVPTMVVVLLASTAGVLGTGSGATRASAVSDGELALENTAIRRESLRRNIWQVGGGALVLVLAGVAAWTMIFSGVQHTAGETTNSGTVTTGTDDPRGNGDPNNGGPDGPGQSADPFKESASGSASGKDDGSNGDNSDSDGNDNGGGGNNLPPGVRSASWLKPPANYVAGGRDAKLLLAVEFDPDTEPSNYLVEVQVPDGVKVTRASAGCTIDASTVVCAPTAEMLNLRLFNFQFFTDLSEDAGLPVVTVRKQ